MYPSTPWLGILSSMITPAVLILACGSLITATSHRLGRVVDRVRKIAQEFAQLEKSAEVAGAAETKRQILFSLLQKSARRSKLLTRAMTLLYVSLGLFVATSLSIGILGIAHLAFTWIPTALGMVGAIFLFISSAVLIVESRLTLSVIADEMDYVIESSRTHAPDEGVTKKRSAWRTWFRR